MVKLLEQVSFTWSSLRLQQAVPSPWNAPLWEAKIAGEGRATGGDEAASEHLEIHVNF